MASISKTELKNSIVQQNIAFIYGRKPEEGQHDLDKRSYVKSVPKMIEKVITDFSGEHQFLSPSFPCSVYLPGEANDGESYASFEHALQASKVNSSEFKLRQAIRTTSDIREVKKLLKDYPVDANWKKEYCLIIGERLVRDKFFRSKVLRGQLMKTIDFKLEYRNLYGDTFWGTTISGDDVRGANHLGKLLEKIRGEINEGEDLDKWMAQSFRLISPNKIRIRINTMEGGYVLNDELKEIRELNPLYVGKADDSEMIVSHARYAYLNFFESF